MLFFLHKRKKHSWDSRFVLRIFLLYHVFWRHAVLLRMFTVFSQYLFKTLESAYQSFTIAFTVIRHTQFPELSGLDRGFFYARSE